jgi:hypothetical protein
MYRMACGVAAACGEMWRHESMDHQWHRQHGAHRQHVACRGMWHINNGLWHVAWIVWHVAWHVACGSNERKCGVWHVACGNVASWRNGMPGSMWHQWHVANNCMLALWRGMSIA